MAKKRSYWLNEDAQPGQDKSFKSCICIMLIILTLCVIILLTMKAMSASKSKASPKEEVEVFKSDANKGSPNRNEKIVIIQVPPTESTRKHTQTTENILRQKYTERTEGSHTDEIFSDFSTESNRFAIHNEVSEKEIEAYTTSTEKEVSQITEENEGKHIAIVGTAPHEDSETTSEVTYSTKILDYTEYTAENNEKHIQGKDFVTTSDYSTDDFTKNVETDPQATTETSDYNKEAISEQNYEVNCTVYTTEENKSEENISVAHTFQTAEETESTQYENTEEMSTTEELDYVTLFTDNVAENTTRNSTYVSETYSSPTVEPYTPEETEKNSSTTEENTEFTIVHYILGGNRENRSTTEETYGTTEATEYSSEDAEGWGTTFKTNYETSTEETYEATNSTEDWRTTFMTDYETSFTGADSVEEDQTSATTKVDFDLSTTTLTFEETSEDFMDASSTFQPVEKICNSIECKKEASRMLSFLNHSAIPCDDFYDFACGNWKESDKYPQYEMFLKNKNVKSESITKFQNFFTSCLNYENYFNYTHRVLTLQNIVTAIGSFDVGGTPPMDEDSFTDLISELVLLQSNPLFDIGLDIVGTTSEYVLQLTLPSASSLRNSLRDWSHDADVQTRCLKELQTETYEQTLYLSTLYEDYESCKIKFNWHRYADAIEHLIAELNLFSNMDSLQKEAISNATREIITYNILSDTPKKNDLRKAINSKDYNIRNVEHLEKNYPLVQWKRLLKSVTGNDVTDGTMVQVYFENHFNLLFNQLTQKLDRSKIKNALLAILASTLYHKIVIPREVANREEYCLSLAQDLMPNVANFIVKSSYEKLEFEKKRNATTELFKYLQDSLKISFRNEEWMTDETKRKSITKLDLLELTFNDVGHLDQDQLDLDSSYRSLDLSVHTFQDNLINLIKHYRKQVYSFSGNRMATEDLFNFFIGPSSKKPVTYYGTNIMAVPIGYLKDIQNNLPDYITLAQSGFHLSKAILKHYDPIGIQYNLPPDAIILYRQLETKYNYIINGDYHKYLGKQLHYKVNSSLSVNERIIEDAAFHLLNESIRYHFSLEKSLPWISSSYSNDQIFFIAAVQGLCSKDSALDFMLQAYESDNLPSVLRVENMMFNSKTFANVFNCPIGSGLYNELSGGPVFPDIPEDTAYSEDEDYYNSSPFN